MIFGRKRKRNLMTSRPKTLKEILTESFKTELDKDPELKKRIAFKEFGHEDLISQDPTAKAKKDFETWRWQQAIQRAKDDPDFNQELTESVIDELQGGKPRRRKTEIESYSEGGFSSVSEAIQEYMNVKEQLTELGVGEGSQGFFKGMSMKDILAALPYIATLMGKGEPSAGDRPLRTYVVRVNGQDREVTEPEYRKLIEQGRLQPVAALTKPESQEPEETGEEPSPMIPEESLEELEPTGEPILPEEPAAGPELPEFLQGVDFSQIEGWLEVEPGDYVENLKSEVEAGVEESIFIYGFLKNINLEGTIKLITPYRNHPTVGNLVERLLTEEGQNWLSEVLRLVQEE